MLDGQNKYKCPKQGKGVRAVKRMTVDAAPNVLMIQLKRFEFSFSGHKISKKVGASPPPGRLLRAGQWLWSGSRLGGSGAACCHCAAFSPNRSAGSLPAWLPAQSAAASLRRWRSCLPQPLPALLARYGRPARHRRSSALPPLNSCAPAAHPGRSTLIWSWT